MAEIDAAISKLISELKKLQGDAGGRASEDFPSDESTKNAQEIRQIIREINNEYDKKLGIESKSIENAKQQKALADDNLKKLKDELKGEQELTDIQKEQLQIAAKQVREAGLFVEKTREAAEAAKDLGGSFANIFGGADAIKFDDLLNPKKIIDLASNINKVVQGKGEMVAVDQMATQASMMFATAIISQTIALANTEASFMKATGASKEFAGSLTNSFEETRKFGATMEETSAAYQELYTSFTDFTMLTASQRESVAETTTLLGKLGMSNSDVAKSIQTSTKAMGMSASQAGQNLLDLEKFAENLGVAPSQMAADFAGAGDMLAKLGSQGTKAFKDLAIVAKTTGMQIETIVNLTNKFDTFEGAADQAGKLNAALGGNFVNAMDLMMATNPAERFEMIRDSILDTGLTFDEMSYYQKNFYKESLGLSDVGELAALMSGDMDLVAGATEDSAQSMIEAKKRAHEMATMQERLNVLLTQIIPIIEPVVELLIDMTEGMAKSAESYAPFIQYIGGAILSLTALAKGLSMIKSIFGDSEGFFGTITSKIMDATAARIGDAFAAKIQAEAQNKVNKANSGGSRSLSQLGQAASKGAKGLLAIGAAALMIGAGFALAAYGLSQLVLAFAGLGDMAPYALGAIVAFTVGFAVLMALLVYSLPVLGPAALGLLAIGAAALMMGAGIAIAAYGMSLLVESFADLAPDKILAIAGAMAAFAISVYALAAAGAAATFGAVGLVVLTGAVMGMAFALMLIEDLILGVADAFVQMFSTIGNPEVGSNIQKIAEAIEAIPTRKNVEFATSMGALAAANTAAAALGAVTAVTNVVTGERTTQEKRKGDVYRVELPIIINGKQVSKEVVELMDGAATRAAAGRGVAP